METAENKKERVGGGGGGGEQKALMLPYERGGGRGRCEMGGVSSLWKIENNLW